ncbi:MAG: DEAD/DEAH box helicase, partial [candidate division KSB1 bacterium]
MPVPFHPAIAQWFEKNFNHPSPPQEKGWPVIAAGEHTLILAPTGSGKTLAALLWCIDDLFRAGLKTEEKEFSRNREGVHTLYLSPLKALNNDIHRNLQEPLAGIRSTAQELGVQSPPLHVAVRTGDTPANVRQSMLRKPPHILITTPESLFLLLTSKHGREIFRNLRYLIVDEIHAVSNNKRGVHLSLSLERLMALCEREPVRIGLSATQRPLERIAAFLGGQKFSGYENFTPRPVTIVDCGRRKEMDLQVLAPVADFGDLPEASVWPAVINKLYELIRSHRNTLVFVNMRAQTERVARQLNEKHRELMNDDNAELALAHHGSISRETRYEIEGRLKSGSISAVIATASLELGIDIGSIDLVVQLESPKSVSSALQRVGRSGHVLSATSKGRLIPLYPSDLDDAVSLTHSMLAGEIEESFIPENCLDVLAQQLVAEVAMRDWPRPELYHLVRQSYCYRHLAVAVFNNVLDMLAGRYASAPMRALQPRLSWDKVNDQLIGRRGSRMLAVMSGGTIPDRGYYSVYLADSNTKLGEMEEEFVFESRVGHVFFLGNNEWRIEQILQDRIIVAPVAAVKPRAPFWKGDSLYRDFATSQRIAAFRRELMEKIERGEGETWLRETCRADEDTAHNLQDYLVRQFEHTAALPTDKQFILESFRDSANEPHIVLHTCCGGRVNGAWAIALATAIERRYQTEVQYSFNDDGIVMRLLDTENALPFTNFLALPAEQIEQHLIEALADSALFASHFRYNATSALLLPRSRQGKRIPLWLQRLRAADLLQVARQFEDFPILLETYRDCLEDVFDLRSLRVVIAKLQAGEIRVHEIETPFPSPMASGLMFQFLASNLYGEDRTRYPGHVANVSSELLAELLSRESIPAIVTAELIAETEARWQYLSLERKAKSKEELFDVIEKLGPIDEEALRARCESEPREWLEELREAKRIVPVAAQPPRTVIPEGPSLELGAVPSAREASSKMTMQEGVHAPTKSSVILEGPYLELETVPSTREGSSRMTEMGGAQHIDEPQQSSQTVIQNGIFLSTGDEASAVTPASFSSAEKDSYGMTTSGDVNEGRGCGWIAATDAHLFEAPMSEDKARTLVQRHLRVRGPLSFYQLEQALYLPKEFLEKALNDLHAAKQLVRGELVQGLHKTQWCDRQNFAELYRRAIALRRAANAPASRATFYQFLLRWHKIGMSGQALLELAKRYRGLRLPLQFFEREILRSRFGVEELQKANEEFAASIAAGDLILSAQREGEEGRRYLKLQLRGEGNLLARKSDLLERAASLDDAARTVFEFLKENGASLLRDMSIGAGLSTAQLE